MAKQRFSILNLRILGSFFLVESQIRKTVSSDGAPRMPEASESRNSIEAGTEIRSQSKMGKLCFVLLLRVRSDMMGWLDIDLIGLIDVML